MAAVRASLTAALFVKLAFEFLVLTAARSHEVGRIPDFPEQCSV